MANRALLLSMLEATAASDSGFKVNDRDHAVQVATRARRAGADDEVVVAALFHDSGKAIDPVIHGSLIAKMLAPHVRPEVVFMLDSHQDYTANQLDNGRFQGARLVHSWRGRRHQIAKRFVDEWDIPGRDPEYINDPLESFYPEVDRVLNQQRVVKPPLLRRFRQRAMRKLWRAPGALKRKLGARIGAVRADASATC